MVSDVEFRVLSSESIVSAPGWHTISGVVNMGNSAPELLNVVIILRRAGAVHMNVIPLTYRFATSSLNVQVLHERLKRMS